MADGRLQMAEVKHGSSAVRALPSAIRKGGEGMTAQRKIFLGVAAWLAVITAAHMATNVDWKVLLNDRLPESERKLNVAYIPVT